MFRSILRVQINLSISILFLPPVPLSSVITCHRMDVDDSLAGRTPRRTGAPGSRLKQRPRPSAAALLIASRPNYCTQKGFCSSKLPNLRAGPFTALRPRLCSASYLTCLPELGTKYIDNKTYV